MNAKRLHDRVGRGRVKNVPVHPKLDPRLAFLLQLPARQLLGLKKGEDERLRNLDREVRAALEELERRSESGGRDEAITRLRQVGDRLFAPLTTGVHLPSVSRKYSPWPAAPREPYLSAFLLSSAGARDLTRLGARIRSQAGDVFVAYVPLAAIRALEASPAVHFIELARPLFPTLNQAVPYAQINALQNANPAINGAGVVVGVSDDVIDIYHPDFRAAGGATRLLFLWDQTLAPQGGEAGPPTAPALPGFTPTGGVTYGVEYNQATINAELNAFNPPAVPAYQTVRHGGAVAAHGTHVSSIAAGNGLGQGGTFTGAAPASNIIFVRRAGVAGTALFTDGAGMADAFAYIFARAAQLGQPCVVNMSASDNQGPHDGTTLGEQFLDNLLLAPGRVLTLSAGNSNNTGSHAAGNVAQGGVANLALNYQAGAGSSDDVEIWYDGHDRLTVTVTCPTNPATVIGPVAPGAAANAALGNGVQVQVTSGLNDPRNGDNLISIIIQVPANQTIPAGNWVIALTGTTVVNGTFQAWVDRNNRGLSSWQAPFLQEGTLTLGVPATARRPITVGSHDNAGPPPNIAGTSGRGPTRDGRIKPELATVGAPVTAARSRNMNAAVPGALYVGMGGTSMAAPLVAGACAQIFQCRGGGLSWANVKQILETLAGNPGVATPGNVFGFGFLQVGTACTAPAPNVDVWVRDHANDTGLEPFAGGIAWLSPDIEVLDRNGNPTPNPTHDPARRFNNLVRVTVRNRGTQPANNTEVYLYWADPATNIPFPAAWNATGIYTGAPNYVNQSNVQVIPQLAAGASAQLLFAWAPPPPGSNLRGDDHFCLLARLENEGDASNLGAGGWAAITASNNVALRNVHVQPDDPNDTDMSFYVEGSDDQDSLEVHTELAGGRAVLTLPVGLLPWRDIRVIAQLGSRQPFGCGELPSTLARLKATIRGQEVERVTDIVGAERLDVGNGVARVMAAGKGPLAVPYLLLATGVRVPARIEVAGLKIDKKRRFVHVAQRAGGQLVGGVTLEFRPRREMPRLDE